MVGLEEINQEPASSAPDVEPRPRKTLPASAAWVGVGKVDDFPRDGGAAIEYDGVQIAVFRFTSRDEWYACQNMCPHQRALVLSRGILGNTGPTPKVSCPLHKKLFSLENGESLSGEPMSIKVFSVKVEEDNVLLLLPPAEQLRTLVESECSGKAGCFVKPPEACETR